MKCPVCKDIDLQIIKETNQYFTNTTNFAKCKCGKTFLRRTEFYPSGIISQDILYALDENNTWRLYRELYHKI